MMTVKIVCIEVALLFSHKDEKTSLFSEDKIKSVRKSPLTPVFRWKSALKIFPMMTVKTVCIEVALLISHKDENTSLFQKTNWEVLKKVLSLPFLKGSMFSGPSDSSLDVTSYSAHRESYSVIFSASFLYFLLFQESFLLWVHKFSEKVV